MMIRRRSISAALATALAGCVTQPISAPVPHESTVINASFGKTWDALIDQFAARNIPIKTIDRASGLVATDALKVGNVGVVADCGTSMGTKLVPTDATYNAIVRGDSVRTTVRVTVRWVRVGMSRAFMNTDTVSEECSTNGTWETSLEQAVKSAAEKKP